MTLRRPLEASGGSGGTDMLSGGPGWAKAWKNQRSEVFSSPELGQGFSRGYKRLDTRDWRVFNARLKVETLGALKSFETGEGHGLV